MKVEREKKTLELWKSVSSQIPSRTESHHLTASLWLSPSDHTLSATKKKKKMFPRIAALHMKTPSQPLYLFTSCSLFGAPLWQMRWSEKAY